MNRTAIYSLDGVGIMLMLVLFLCTPKISGKKSRGERLYSFLMILITAQCVMDILVTLLDGWIFPGSLWLNRFFNAALFLGAAGLGHTWILYIVDRLRKDQYPLWIRILHYASLGLVTALSILNLFTDVIFRISPENIYSRTPLTSVVFALVMLSLLLSVLLLLATDNRDQYAFFPVFCFILPISIGFLVQALLQGVNTVWVGCAVGMIALSTSLKNEAAMLDVLTGLYTRQYLHAQLAAREQKHHADLLSGVMIDLDRFKALNDTYGHLVGDNALRAAGTLFRRNLPPHAYAFRFGGDEFVILSETDGEGIRKITEDLKQAADRYNAAAEEPLKLFFSCGTATWLPGDTAETFFHRMDQAMYGEKTRMARRSTDR